MLFLFCQPHLWDESGCKDNTVSTFHPNIFASFFKLFFRTYVSTPAESLRNRGLVSADEPRTESGCKDKDFLTQSKFSGKKIGNFFFKPSFLQHPEELCTTQKTGNQTTKTNYLTLMFNPSFPDCGCKDNTIFIRYPKFFIYFFQKK